MKARNLIYIAVVSIAIGAALIVANKSISSNGVVMAGGIIFIVASLINALVIYLEKKDSSRSVLTSMSGQLANVGALVLGICLLIFRSTFVVLVPYIFGIIVAIAACYQFFILAMGARPATLPGWLYLVPIVLVGAAIYLFTRHANAGEDHIIILVSGIALALFGIFTIIEASIIHHLRAKLTPKDEEKEDPQEQPAKTIAPKPLDPEE